MIHGHVLPSPFVTFCSVITAVEERNYLESPFRPVLEYLLSPILFFFNPSRLHYIITPAREKNWDVRKIEPRNHQVENYRRSGEKKGTFPIHRERTKRASS